MIDLAALRAPFPPEQVSWRVGSTTQDKTKGMALAYIDSRDVMERLDEACGPAGWQCVYPHVAGKTVCNIGIKCDDEWIWKADGAGDTDVEAEKGALSDAFKRAAVKWGIGRYLYDVESPWVELKAAGRSYSIADKELPRLRHVLARAAGAPPQRQDRAPAPAQAAQDERLPAGLVRDQMLRDIADRATSVALDKMTNSPRWKEDFTGLPEADRKTVTAAVQRRGDQLTAELRRAG